MTDSGKRHVKSKVRQYSSAELMDMNTILLFEG